jgi:hypothetical protein
VDSPIFSYTLIKAYSKEMFDTLLYKHHLSSNTPKVVEFDDNEVGSKANGYYFTKNNVKYLLDDKDNDGINNLTKLPIRVMETTERETKTKEVVLHITKYKSFKPIPDKVYTIKQIMALDGITHMNPDCWTMQKVIAFTAYTARINVYLSAVRRSGKTSYLSSLGKITNKGYVVDKPRSVAGLAKGISEDGYIVLDEMGSMTREEKEGVYNFLFQAGGMNPDFTTGKAESAQHHLNSIYSIQNLSVVLVCNLFEDYLCNDEVSGELDIKNKDKFIQYLFDNGQAINDRFMPLRMNPPGFPLTKKEREPLPVFLDVSQFKTTTDVLTDEYRDVYRGIIKSMEHYKINRNTLIDWDFVDKHMVPNNVKGRHFNTYRELLGTIYLLGCDMDSIEPVFQHFKDVLDSWYSWYYEALVYWQTKALTGSVPEVFVRYQGKDIEKEWM